MPQWNHKEIHPQSVFKLLQTTSVEMNSLNKGFNKGETTIGFFHFVGYCEQDKLYLITKPSIDEEIAIKRIILNENYFHDHCICLLSFTLNNN